ncbi:hypothetical protein I4641_15805 [Waterburya agarophytonicola K14]|uniref:Uncharacterized protein n=1 Tax=Waterburya agarophytonicola KI4 TaxID=2874699 RepID=A0A964BUH3_9CYAN|nr:hypothetical protein [Waterburya agarophytonicola]MCC0178441.1 hypothetical protein [Waterburya agarophytonicola KI4]
MKFYHGTSERYLQQILKDGLQPRGGRYGNWEKCPSRGDCVYLTVAYAPYYGYFTANKEERIVVVEVDSNLLDRVNLLPDEDYIAQASHESAIPGSTLEERTIWVRDRLHTLGNYQEMSLNGLGNCCYRGAIPLEAITRIAIAAPDKTNHLCLMAADPTITLMNFALMRKVYQNLTRAFAGYPVEARTLILDCVATLREKIDAEKFAEYLDLLQAEMETIKVMDVEASRAIAV